MRYPANEKLEIIRLVEQSSLPVKRTLAKLSVSRPTFYRWYDLYRRFGEAGLEDRRSGPSRSWNRIPVTVREQILALALDRPELRSCPRRWCKFGSPAGLSRFRWMRSGPHPGGHHCRVLARFPGSYSAG
jgi:transposase-like protein